MIGAALPKGGRFAEGRHVHLTRLVGSDVENGGVDEFMWPVETVWEVDGFGTLGVWRL